MKHQQAKMLISHKNFILGFVLQLNTTDSTPICQLQVCKEEEAEYRDNQCYLPGTQGPCDEFQQYQLNDDMEPYCSVDSRKVARIFDSLPKFQPFVRFGPITKKVKLPVCVSNANGNCRKPKRRRQFMRKSSPKLYLKWLKSFRK